MTIDAHVTDLQKVRKTRANNNEFNKDTYKVLIYYSHLPIRIQF